MPVDPATGIFYRVEGRGLPLMVTLPLFASQAEILGAEADAVLEAYLAGLTDHCRVLLLDYPSIGRSAGIAPDALVADRVAADWLSVATAAGFDRFAVWGYSWGAAAAFQLAARTERVDALLMGGWSPLGGPHPEALAAAHSKLGNPDTGALKVLRSRAQYAQWVHYYESLEGFDEGAALARVASIPRLLYFGADGDVSENGFVIPIASRARQARPALEAQGWQVHEVAGQGHGLAFQPDAVVPIIRPFLQGLPARTQAM
jgi:pimeloyl-ACP methyl ester carboxylesterase